MGESWFTCDVPQLKAHGLLVPVEHFECEIHADGGSVVGAKVVVDISLDDTGLPNPEVAYHKNLIEMLLMVVVLHGDRGGRESSMNPPYWEDLGMIAGDAQDSAERAGESWEWEGAARYALAHRGKRSRDVWTL